MSKTGRLNAMRPVWLEIDLGRLACNYRLLAAKAPDAKVVGVVKANAYGHGAAVIGRELIQLGAWGLAVATVSEGKALRQAGITAPVLLLGSLHPDESEDVLNEKLTPFIGTWEAAAGLEAAARARGIVAEAHVKVDTGMGRVGVPAAGAKNFVDMASKLSHLRVTGIASHLASADEDPVQTNDQIKQFQEVKRVLGPGYLYHLANTYGILGFPQASFDMVRPGYGLYGLAENTGLMPIARLLAKPSLIKQVNAGTPIGYGAFYRARENEWVATLPVGYADGVPRPLVGKGAVRLGQKTLPMVGRISMDQITVRLEEQTNLEEVFEVLTPDFHPLTSLNGWANLVGTVAYETAVRLSPRLPRVYVRNGVQVERVEA